MIILGTVLATLAVGTAIGLAIRADGDAGAAPSTTYTMGGTGMEPTYRHRELITAREIDGDEVGRGDIVMFELPEGFAHGSSPVVKRVVAVAGDEVASDGDALLVNGAAADEPYLAPGTTTTDVTPQEVPAGHVFVMGDNRINAQDSRRFGPVPTDDIVALVE